METHGCQERRELGLAKHRAQDGNGLSGYMNLTSTSFLDASTSRLSLLSFDDTPFSLLGSPTRHDYIYYSGRTFTCARPKLSTTAASYYTLFYLVQYSTFPPSPRPGSPPRLQFSSDREQDHFIGTPLLHIGRSFVFRSEGSTHIYLQLDSCTSHLGSF